MAYPASYFLGRALVYRARRGRWSEKARTELRAAVPWMAVTAIGAALLAISRPAIILGAIPVLLVWLASLRLTWMGRERGIANDLLRVALASLAPILMWVASSGSWDIPRAQWIVVAVSALFFTGSVLHVKSLIREARDKRWKIASVGYAFLCIPISALISLWLVPGFILAALRTLFMRPGLKPGAIGGVEAVLSVVMILATVLAVR
jgi:hypothetical protein